MADMRDAMTALLLLPSLATMLLAATPLPADNIAVDLNTWGTVVSSWRISRDGSVEYHYRRPGPLSGREQDAFDLVIKRFHSSPAAFARIEAIVRPVQRMRSLDCGGNRITDQPYGHFRWQVGERTRELRFDLGCNGSRFQRATERLWQAGVVIEELARSAPEIEVRRIPAMQ
jgi:hypothetical protein